MCNFEKLGQNLRQIRKERKLTQARVASDLGYRNHVPVHMAEKGKCKATMYKLFDYYGYELTLMRKFQDNEY